jgi:ABC-type bacteriocin/lantibiotic exporter with double-glycine peptidase domain
MAAATIVRSDTARPEEPAPDRLLLAFLRLCRQLERPVSEAELRSLAVVPAGGADPACLGRLAERLGLGIRSVRIGTSTLASLPTPFLVLGREPGTVWLVRARTHDQLVLVEPVHGAPPPARSRP